MEKGETAQQAAEREIKEELGVQLKNVHELGATDFIENGQDFHYTWFGAEIASGKPRPVEEKHDRVAYFSMYELKQQTVSNNVKKLIDVIEDGTIKL